MKIRKTEGTFSLPRMPAYSDWVSDLNPLQHSQQSPGWWTRPGGQSGLKHRHRGWEVDSGGQVAPQVLDLGKLADLQAQLSCQHNNQR